jgi:hypothetical protein
VLGPGVEPGARLIQEQERRRFPKNGPGYRHLLPLAGRQLGAVELPAELGLQALGQPAGDVGALRTGEGGCDRCGVVYGVI